MTNGESAAHLLTREDYAAIKEVLITWRKHGVENPLLPMNVDIDGDGIVDSWGLDSEDRVIVVSGVNLEDTVYLSEGDDAINHLPEGVS